MMTYRIAPRRLAHRFPVEGEAAQNSVHIPVDVRVEEDDFLITAFVPGVSAEDVKIEILDDTVSLSGEFLKDASEDVAYLLQERPSGAFHRRMRMPSALNAAKAEAQVTNGVLSLRIPKAEEAKAKQIKVIAK
ncbi:MAG: Hsp20/alpha crystallin family protein [Anaerolineae bacterium]|nr:Hsp20/alpha crystallin family protein [Anaerolineae bacterium]